MDLATTVVLTAVLVAAVWTDARKGIIPNLLIIFGLLASLTLALLQGADAVWSALVGVVLGLVVLLPAYAWAGMGAGDVKLMAVVGGFVGPKGVLLSTVGSLIAGALLGVIVLLAHGGGQAFARRYWQMLSGLVATGRFAYYPPPQNDAALRPLPYALAIALGTFWLLWYQGQWSTLLQALGFHPL